MANIRSDFTNANIESGLKKLDVRDFIFQLEPEEAPFVTVLNKIRKESCRDIEFSWFEDIAVGKYTQINNGGSAYTDATTELIVDDADIFQIGDLVQAVVAAHPEIMRVTDVDPTGGVAQHIHVTRAFGTTAAHADAVANNVYLYRIGQSMAEGYTVGDQLITTKSKVSNYVQIFSRPVQFTETANAISTFGGNRRNYERKKVGIELKKDIETQFLFGEPYYTATGPKYQTGGIKHFMSTTSPALNAAGALHKDDFDGWLKDAMHYGSSEKFLFASPLILAYINGFADTYLRTDPGQIKTWGVRFSTYTSPFGDINIVMNRNFVGPYAGEAILLDMKELVYRYLEGLDLKLSTDLQPSNVHYLLDEYAGTIGLEIHSPLKHARIYGTT
jgi:hypothetical protein